MRAPKRIAGLPAPVETKPRLTQLSPVLWLDLSEVISVQTYTARTTYHRMVELRLRGGEIYKVVAHHPRSHQLASHGDEALEAWLAEHLGELLTDSGAAPAAPAAGPTA